MTRGKTITRLLRLRFAPARNDRCRRHCEAFERRPWQSQGIASLAMTQGKMARNETKNPYVAKQSFRIKTAHLVGNKKNRNGRFTEFYFIISFTCSRITFLSSFPTLVFGIESTNKILSGTPHLEITPFSTKSM